MEFIYDPSLVLYLPLYKLDGASFMSRDAYGHLCTVTGALWRPNGRNLDGTDDFLSVPDCAALHIPVAITLEGWVKLDSYTAGGATTDRATIATKGSSYYMTVTSATGKLAFFMYGAHPTHTDSTSQVPLGRFVHTAIIYGNGNITWYIQGEIDKSAAAAPGGAIAASNNVLGIGGESSGIGRFLDGTVGEVRVYSRALNPLEIQHNYLATKWRYL